MGEHLNGRVTQMARVFALQAKSQGFESLHAHIMVDAMSRKKPKTQKRIYQD